MPCSHLARTISQDRADAFPLPGRTHRAHPASRSTRPRGAARPHRGTLSIDRSTGITPCRLEPSLPPRYEIVGLYPDSRDIETEQVFSVHHDESVAWSAFHEALLHTDAPHGPAALPQPRQDGARLLRAPAVQRHLRRRHPRPGLVLTGHGLAASANHRPEPVAPRGLPGMTAGDRGRLSGPVNRQSPERGRLP